MKNVYNIKNLCPVENPFDQVNNEIIEQYGGDFEKLPCYVLYTGELYDWVSEEYKCNIPVGTKGDKNSEVVIVGQCPYKEEIKIGEPFVGGSGNKLNNILKDIGYDISDFYVTNAVKCPADTVDLKLSMIKVCSTCILRREILEIKPKLIICLGEKAFKGVQYALFGKAPYKFARGNIYEFSLNFSDYKKVKVATTYHPSYILQHKHYEPIFAKDLSNFLSSKKKEIQYKVLDSVERVERFVNSIITQNKEVELVFDIETYHKDCYDFKNNGIICIGFALDDSNGYVIPLKQFHPVKNKLLTFFVEGEQEKVEDLIRKLFLSDNVKLIGHNITFDTLILYYYLGVNVVKKIYRDTMIMHHLLRENPPHDLKTLATLYTDFGNYYQETKEAFKESKSEWYKFVDYEELLKYCAYDCCVTFSLYQFFEKRIQFIAQKQKDISNDYLSKLKRAESIGIAKKDDFNSRKTFYQPLLYTKIQLDKLLEVQIKHLHILIEMQINGMPISKSYVSRIEKEVLEQIKKKEKELNDLAGEPINWKSSKQISYIFKKLRYISPIKTPKGQPSYNEEALKYFAEKENLEIAKKLLEYRNLVKMYSTYVKILDNYKYRWIETEDDDIVRISCKINPVGTETGRLSTSNPCFHQIPRENLYRNMVVARAGWLIVSADYSMADLRMICGYSACESMYKDFESGVDFHKQTAAQIFGKSLEEVTSEERSLSKSINFGIAYLSSAYGLAQRLGISVEKAQEFINKWFEARPEVKSFIDKIINRYNKAMEGEEVVFFNIFGRCRRVIRVPKFYVKPNGKKKYNPEYGHIVRELVNFYPQSTVADMLAIGLIRLNKFLEQNDLKKYCKFLLTIHDAVLLEVKQEYVEGIKKLVKEAFEFPIPFPYKPLVVPIDFTIDKKWIKD